MLVRYFRRPSRIEQLRSSTGGHLLEGFAKELSQGRYQWVAARKHIRAAEHFLHWIAHRNLSITSVAERYAQQFFDHLKRCCCRGHHPPLKPHRQKYSVDLWFDYLRRVGIVPTPAFVEPAVEAPMLTAFCDWMRRQRGVSGATLSIYRFELRAFIKDLGEDPHMYDALNLRQFVLDKSQHSGWAPARKCICAVRMFLRFLISQGRCPDYLYASIPTFAHWRLSALPFCLQADQVEQVIASPDLATSLGRRNRAILLLLARLGLRASDIVQLRLANRLTGISTPLVRVSWQPTDLEVSAARRVIAFLEDRRVLYAPEEMEVASHCVQSVLEIRHFLLSGELGKLDANPSLRPACEPCEPPAGSSWTGSGLMAGR
jgi:hypothetical protein